MFSFQFLIIRSAIVCNFTNERKPLVSGGGGQRFPFGTLLLAPAKSFAWGCKCHLLVDEIISDVTASISSMLVGSK